MSPLGQAPIGKPQEYEAGQQRPAHTIHARLDACARVPAKYLDVNLIFRLVVVKTCIRQSLLMQLNVS